MSLIYSAKFNGLTIKKQLGKYQWESTSSNLLILSCGLLLQLGMEAQLLTRALILAIIVGSSTGQFSAALF